MPWRSRRLSDFELAAYHSVMTLTGSALIAMMLARGATVPEAAWLAAHVDEDYQIEQWGQDAEAQASRAARYTEFMACCRFMALATSPCPHPGEGRGPADGRVSWSLPLAGMSG